MVRAHGGVAAAEPIQVLELLGEGSVGGGAFGAFKGCWARARQ
jgi:hypothetical protein